MGNPEKIQSLKGRVAADPYDNVAWEQLLGEISRGRKSEEQAAQLREVYEDLLSKFPTAVSQNIGDHRIYNTQLFYFDFIVR